MGPTLDRLGFAAAVRGLATPSSRLFRVAGLFAIAFAVACGDVGPTDDTADQSAAALEEEAFVGDRVPAGQAEGPTRAPSFRLDPHAIASAPAKVVLTFTWNGQETGYWCGPGSTRMAIGTHVASPPSQQDLATFMGTTKEGTVRADTVRALNQWLAPQTPYQSFAVDSVPTQDQRDLLKQTVVARLSAGWPVIANVLSGWRPPGYPSGTIGHFVAVMGYDESGDKVLIADPAADGAASARWKDVPKTYWISMQNLGTWVGGRGFDG
jgi:hypothetical protein